MNLVHGHYKIDEHFCDIRVSLSDEDTCSAFSTLMLSKFWILAAAFKGSHVVYSQGKMYGYYRPDPRAILNYSNQVRDSLTSVQRAACYSYVLFAK